MLFILSRLYNKTYPNFPREIEPKTFGFHASILYYRVTEKSLTSQAFVKFI